jgi:predicted transport protein
MSQIKIFELKGSTTKELKSNSVHIEKELQTLIENNMTSFFGIDFLVTEYSIDNGRIDSIGIDENNSPVIFEYKRHSDENVINQGLFYMDWLVTHKDSFYRIVSEKKGKQKADAVDWSSPQLLCIANDFTKFDENAIKQMKANISLYRYMKYEKKLICFELLGSNQINTETKQAKQVNKKDKTFDEIYAESSAEIQELFQTTKQFILEFAEDISEQKLKLYTAFKKIKNIICIEIHKEKLVCYLRLDPNDYKEIKEIRDVSKIGHWGTGDLEIELFSINDFNKFKTLFEDSYLKN